MTKAIPELSIEARLLTERLKKAEVGEVIPYSELSEVAGRTIQGAARSSLYTAMKRCLNSEGYVFGTVRGVGVKRLSDKEIIGIGDKALPHIRRTAKRAARKMSMVENYEGLEHEDKVRHNAMISALGMMAHVANEKQIKKLEDKVHTAQGALPIGRTLEVFKG